jgi:hypothetical protein
MDADVATEVGGAVGLMLWLRLRDVVLWARVPEGERKDLFGPVAPEHEEWEVEAASVDALTTAVRTLSALARYPELVRGVDVAIACSEISTWAMATEKRETSLHFAEAAALGRSLECSTLRRGWFCVRRRSGSYTLERRRGRAVEIGRRRSPGGHLV